MKTIEAIAVVIPALDEVDRVGAAVISARTGESGGSEADPRIGVVVVDGGSRDGTAEAARRAGARVIESPPGRARQIEAGWRASHADAVVFLHADTTLPDGWATSLAAALRDPDVAGGAFRFGLDARGATWRGLEWGVALRVALLGLPYGDQALFVRRSVLEASGGVRDVAILEDLDLVRAIKRAGRLRVLPLRVRTSARRHREGLVATVARHALALGGFFLGVDRDWLARRVRG